MTQSGGHSRHQRLERRSKPRPYNFQEQVIAVTGGSGDFGRAIREKVDADGACFVVLDTDQARGEACRAKLKHPGSACIPPDVSSSAGTLKKNDLRATSKFTPKRLESSFHVHSVPKARAAAANRPLCRDKSNPAPG
jgi:NAD(P)-dependent dehydrogenase (short-subunit alcohol dehydrogenase family)